MEQFVLGIFQEQLSKFIVGFRKEQVNANLLNGKGEINNVELNCAALNETITKMTPFIELESVHVSKLSFQVTSWTNLRKAPIMIDIEHVRARAVEPLHFWDRSQRRPLRQLMKSQLEQMILEGLLPKPSASPYNIFDRILDNLTIEIATVTLEFQPWGKFKTRREGPWRPPELQLKLADIRLVSVNEFGQEAPPNEVWRHNHHHKTFLIYKRLAMEYQILLRPVGSSEAIPLVTGRDNKVEVQLAMQRRVRDGVWLAVQIDSTIPNVEVDIPAHAVPLLAQAVAGIAFCLAKDRKFVDPLQANNSASAIGKEASESETVVISMTVEETLDKNDTAIVDVDEDAQDDEIPDELAEDSSSSEDEEEESQTPLSTPVAPATSSVSPSRASSTVSSDFPDRPVIVLPNGLIIHEKISLSLSVHHASVKGTYAKDGHVNIEAKGCVAELIWPKVTKEKGAYVQASVSYVSVHEQHLSKRRPILVGGVQYDNKRPIDEPAKPLSAVGRDETFPLYEDRSVRPDPIGLRHTFPAQAFGFKLSVDFIPKLSDSNECNQDDVLFLNEVGIDQFEAVADADAWSRILHFALNTQGGGFDERYFSGDWSKYLTRDMLVHPDDPLILDNHVQPAKQIFLDDNEFISSDLFNVTARITKVVLRVPAAIGEDLRSCDIVARLGEAMLVVSSALPRTFLSGRVGTSSNGSSEDEGDIDFPNDKSDVVFAMQHMEDPSDRQRGVPISHPISTFRMQLTLRDYSLRLVPIIPFCAAEEPRQLITPSELTMLICFEGEPPRDHDDNLIKILIFVSVLVHRFHLNLDMDLLASAIGTLSFHLAALQTTSKEVRGVLRRVEKSESELSDYSTDDGVSESRIRRSLRGRRALVRKQLHRSRENGGLSMALALQVAESGFCIWRQNISSHHPLREVSESTKSVPKGDEMIVSLLKVVSCELTGMEAGVEAVFQKASRRILIKLCLSNAKIEACQASESFQQGMPNDCADMVEVIRLGRTGGNVTNTDQISFALRVEEILDLSRNWALSAQVEDGVVSCRICELEIAFIMLLEALLVSTSAKNHMSREGSRHGMFPDGSVGALLQSLLPSGPFSAEIGGLSFLSLFLKQTERNFVSGKVPGKVIDRILRDFVRHFFPDDVTLAAARITTKNVLTQFPGPARGKDFGCLLQNVEFVASYILKDSDESMKRLLDVVARSSGKNWSTVLGSLDPGLRHKLNSWQSLILMSPPSGHGNNSFHETIVDTFNFGYKYADSKVSLLMTDGLSIENVERLDEFLLASLSFVNRLKATGKKAAMFLVALRRSMYDEQGEGGASFSDEISSETPVVIAHLGTGTMMNFVRGLLRRLSSRIDEYTLSIQKEQSAILNKIDELTMLVFAKERERLGALGLVSAQTAGWLRVGAAQRSGSRGLLSCTLWPHWLVLRRCFLIVYSKPGSYEPVYVLSLKDASLKELTGGKQKRDLKRAFTLVDRAGTVNCLIATSDREYYDWVSCLRTAIAVYSSKGPNMEAELSERPENDCSDEQATGSAHGRPLGKSISRAVRVAKATGRIAKATGRAVVERGRRRGEDDTDTVSVGSSGETEEANQNDESSARGRQVRNRFAGVGQATKSRFGSAFQAAKEKGKQVAQKGKEAAQRRRVGRSDRIYEEATGTDSEKNCDDATNPTVICSRCTFLNGADAVVCSMCQSPLLVESPRDDSLVTLDMDSRTTNDGLQKSHYDESVVGSDNVAVVQSEELAGTVENDMPRPRLSKRLGNAVRSVRRGVSSEEDDTSSPYDLDRHSFNLRLRNGADQVGGIMKLRNISVAGPLPLPAEPFNLPFERAEIPLKQLHGCWYTKVAAIKTSQTPNSSTQSQLASATTTEELTADTSGQGNVLSSEVGLADVSSLHQRANSSATNADKQKPSQEQPGESIPSYVFEIQIYQRVGDGSGSGSTKEITKTFSDVLALHSAMSECVGLLASAPMVPTEKAQVLTRDIIRESAAAMLGLNAFETVRFTGSLLWSLVNSFMNDDSALLYESSGLIEEFLNSLLDCALPIDALAHLVDFLQITEASTEETMIHPTTDRLDLQAHIADMENDIHSLVSSCETGLLRAENQNLLAEKISSTSVQNTRPSEPVEAASTLSFSTALTSSKYQDAIHAALMKVMQERDEAHVRMVAADVLHVHEMDQQRKRINQLEAQLTASGQKNAISAKEGRSDRERHMQQSSDEELVSLCQQLATEISGRTSANLEVARLKEVRQIERESAAIENKALRAEIEELKELLVLERKKTEEARRESGSWRRSFHEAVQHAEE